MHRGYMVRSFLFSMSVVMLCLTVGISVSSIWFGTCTRVANESKTLSLHVGRGWVTLQQEPRMEFIGPIEAQTWWGTIGRSSEPTAHLPFWWLTLPLWMPAAFFSLWPAIRILRSLAPRSRETSAAKPKGLVTQMQGYNWFTGNRFGITIKRLLVASSTILTLVVGSVASLSFWVAFGFGATNQQLPDMVADYPIDLSVDASDGSFDIELRSGAPVWMSGGGDVHWWGSFVNFSVPGGLAWWVNLPGWEPVAALSLWPSVALCRAILRRRRKRRPGYCRQCGYNTFGLTHGICPECGTPLPAESRQEQPVSR